MSIVELAEEESERRGGARVSAVHIKLGRWSGVVREALEGAFEMATEGTALQGSALMGEVVPVLGVCGG
jgi:hydrogenase nickel incorporation protein HypA/HybF